ncbi:hypothetical protein BH11CYA1_BH11CYA1_03520 [soil metagenome]
MQYFIPDLRLTTQLPMQTSIEDKFGGRPWGLPISRWPLCTNCGKHQSLIAQLQHDAVRLDLGADGRVLFVFQCDHNPGECESWDGSSGANSCFVVEGNELLNCTTELPDDKPTIETEARVIGWLIKEDGIDEKIDYELYQANYYALPDEMRAAISEATKLGAVPKWEQNPEEAPLGDWYFVGQINYLMRFYSELPQPDEVGCTVETVVNRRRKSLEPKYLDPRAPHSISPLNDPDTGAKWYCDAPNFGDCGTAYIFLRKTEHQPEGYFFWQCG